MSRRRKRNQGSESAEFGGDSFLDVVTNVVGILIILVVVVGLRVQQTRYAVVPASSPEPEVDLAGLRDRLVSLESDVVRLNDELDALDAETESRFEDRAALAYLLATGQRQLELHRSELDERQREVFDLGRQLEEGQTQLASLETELHQAQSAPGQRIEVASYPTPISSVVDGNEVHFHLAQGLVTPIPLDELLELCREEAKSRMWKLQSQPSVDGVVGPVGGFRLRFVLERVEMAFEGGARTAAYAQLSQWELEPAGPLPGETLEEAQESGSQFRRIVSQLRSRRTTVTLWTYPDSFALYRALRKELYARGLATAGRPLPEGIAIGGSPDGSRSTAQ